MTGSRPPRLAAGTGGPRFGGLLDVWLVLVVAYPAACSPASSQTIRHFPPHERVARGDRVEAELISVSYGEVSTTVQLALRNRGDNPVEVDEGSILLEFEELEYAPLNPTGPSQVAAGQARTVTLRFALGRPFHGPAILSVHHLRRDEQWLPSVVLTVPPEGQAEEGTPSSRTSPTGSR